MSFRVSTDSKTTQQLRSTNKKNNLAFKGIAESAVINAASHAANAIQVNEVINAAGVDIVSMVAPRSTIDWKDCGPSAGKETLRRESFATCNTCLLPGAYAIGSGLAIAKIFGKAYNKTKAPLGMTINSQSIDYFNNAWKNANKTENYWAETTNQNKVIKNYISNTLKDAQGLVGEKWVSFSDEAADSLSEKISKIARNSSKLKKGTIAKKLNRVSEEAVKNLGASSSIRLGKSDNSCVTSMEKLIGNAFNMQHKVFTKQKPEQLDTAIKFLKKHNKIKSAIGIATAVAVGASTQKINRLITKLQTGSDENVAVPKYAQGKSSKPKTAGEKAKFKMSKILSMASMAALATSTIAGSLNPIKILNSNIPSKLEFADKFANLNQLKVIYGGTIMGRQLAASDSNELTTTNIRDFSGFSNWLILGGLVSKVTASVLSKGKLLNGAMPASSNSVKKAVNFLSNRSLKTRGEILAMNLPKEETNKLLKQHSIAIFSGIAYSTAALGIMMPKICNFITGQRIKAQNKSCENENKNEKIQSGIDSNSVVNNEVFSDFIKMKQSFNK